MYLRTILIVLVCTALAIFTAINWHAFTTPTTLSLIFATVEAPLGLILLGAIMLLSALFLIYVLYLQSSVLLETRRYTREIQAQRELAERAEASRIHELRALLENQLHGITEQSEACKLELTARLDRVESELRRSIEENQNALAAALAEMDDHLVHGPAFDPTTRHVTEQPR
jgi:uncharacterized integral membrane protein